MITYPLTLPAGIYPSAYTLGYITNTRTNQSPFTFSTQRIEGMGQAWTLTMQFPPLTEEQAKRMASFMTKLKGQFGSFYFSPKDAWKGTGNGTPTLVSINNTLRSNITIASSNTSFPEGSYVQIGDQLVQFQTAVPASAGNATVDIYPRLRSAVPAGSPIIYGTPVGKFSLNSNTQNWSIERSRHYTFTLEAIESL